MCHLSEHFFLVLFNILFRMLGTVDEYDAIDNSTEKAHVHVSTYKHRRGRQVSLEKKDIHNKHTHTLIDLGCGSPTQLCRKLRLEANILEFAHILFATANTTARLGQLAP